MAKAKVKAKRVQVPRLEFNKRSEIGAWIGDGNGRVEVSLEDRSGGHLLLSEKDTERLFVYLGKCLAYFDYSKRKAAK